METRNTFASLGDRIQSTFIDGLCLIALMFLAGYLLESFEVKQKWIHIGSVILVFCYEPIATSLGCSLGHYLKGIRVRKQSNHEAKLSLPLALIRFALKLGLGVISLLTISRNEQGRAIHDLASGSVMVKLPAADDLTHH